MSSAKTKLYRLIGDHLMDTLGGTGVIEVLEYEGTDQEETIEVPKLQWYDKNRGQIKFLTKELGIPMPAVLISFPDINYESLGSGLQKGATTIRITTLFESFADSHHGSFDQDIALKYFYFNDLIVETLGNFEGSFFTKLQRITEQEDEEHDYLIITNIDFTTEIVYSPSKATPEFITGNPTVTKSTPQPAPVPDNSSGQFVIE